jgi:hypothetical protein
LRPIAELSLVGPQQGNYWYLPADHRGHLPPSPVRCRTRPSVTWRPTTVPTVGSIWLV